MFIILISPQFKSHKNSTSSLFHWQTLGQLQQVRRHETNADVEEKPWSLVYLKQTLGQIKSKNKNSPYKGWWRSVWSLCLYFWRNFSARSAASGMSGWLATALLTTCSEKTSTVRAQALSGGKNKHIKPIFTLMQITSWTQMMWNSILQWLMMHRWGFYSTDTDYLFLMADTMKIIVNFTFLYFKKKFLTCSLCTPEGKKG